MSTDPSMKRYALFHGDQFYPLGGWDDFCSSFDTVEEARTATARLNPKYTWWHVVDTKDELEAVDNKPPTDQTPPDPDALMQP